MLLQPFLALQAALFFYLLPNGLRTDGTDLAFDIVANGTILLAICAWLLHAPTQRQPFHWSPVYFIIALYMLWASVTLLWALDLIEGRKKLVAYCIGFILLFLVVQEVRTRSSVDGIMYVLQTVGWVIIGAGILTLFFSDYHLGTRLKVINVNENSLGVTLISLLPRVIWPVLCSSGTRRHLYMALSAMFIAFTLILVLLSGSRGSSISLVITLLAFWFTKPLRPWGKIGAGLAAGMLMVAPFLLTSLEARFTDPDSGELGSRDILWLAGWHLIRDHPLTGFGVGNGPFGLAPYISELTQQDFHHIIPAHNGGVTGFIGILLYVGIIVAAIWQFIHARRFTAMRPGAYAAYFPLVLVSAVSYFISFIKGGGLEASPTFFLTLALLIIPSQLPNESIPNFDSCPATGPPARPVAASKLRQQ